VNPKAPPVMRLAGLVVLVALGGTLVPASARADVERIREKAVELAQKLARERFEVRAKVAKPAAERVFKDYDFILKDSKIKEVGKEKNDPQAPALGYFLASAIVDMGLAPYTDQLTTYEQSTTADFNGGKLLYTDLVKKLATSSEDADRRKIASLMGPILENEGVFRNEIARRRSAGYVQLGYANYGDFYGKREGMDLAGVRASAESYLTSSQALYDSLFALMAQRVLKTEARRVRFIDLPYLTQGAEFADLFPGSQLERAKRVMKGLGVAIDSYSGFLIDDEVRPGKALAPEAFAVVVPSDVRVSVNPVGGVADIDQYLHALGDAAAFLLTPATAFEPAYLVNRTAQATMTWVPRLVLEDPAWIRANVKADPDRLNAYLAYRAFVSLYNARVLAAAAILEIDTYTGVGDGPEKEFQDTFSTAVGARISTSEGKRAYEYLHELQEASEFQGLLIATALVDHLRAAHGQSWFEDGQSASDLLALWKRAGGLSVDSIVAAAGGDGHSGAEHLAAVQSMLLPNPAGQ
jgi:hypothetical protein